MRNRLGLIRLLLPLALVLATAEISRAEGPQVFFSDMTDGPIQGWAGSQTKGAAVTIWGVNLGSSRGSSSLTVCGATLNQDSDFAEWGATASPTTARGLQRITFWLNSSMQTGPGSIQVTTSGGASGSVPFHCRTSGKIYFISEVGSDANNGLHPTNGEGGNGPWRSAPKVRDLVAGDVAYFRAGLWNTEDSYNGKFGDAWSGSDAVIDFWNTNHGNGTANNSITVASYPGEVARLGDNSIGYAYRHHGSGGDVMNYWTFSKFIWHTKHTVVRWNSNNQPGSSSHIRLVGNDMSTYLDGSSVLSVNAGGGGSDHWYFYGNYIHDGGVNTRGQTPTRRSYGIYHNGYGVSEHVYIGWNEVCYNADGRGIQIYGHDASDTVDNIHIHDNYIHNNQLTGAVLSGGDGSGSYGFVQNLYFYNNIVANNNRARSAPYGGLFVGDTGSGGVGGNFYIWNNTFYKNYFEIQLDITSGAGPDILQLKNNVFMADHQYIDQHPDCHESGGYPTDCSSSSNNLWFGAGNGPGWDKDALHNVDPGLVSSNPTSFLEFRLLGTSPCINKGQQGLTEKDFFGRLRGAQSDIGACEFDSGSAPPPDEPPAAPTTLNVE